MPSYIRQPRSLTAPESVAGCTAAGHEPATTTVPRAVPRRPTVWAGMDRIAFLHDGLLRLEGKSLIGGSAFLIQRRLSSAPDLAARCGPRLWSARLLVLVTPNGPVIHRAVAKIATGTNPADNY